MNKIRGNFNKVDCNIVVVVMSVLVVILGLSLFNAERKLNTLEAEHKSYVASTNKDIKFLEKDRDVLKDLYVEEKNVADQKTKEAKQIKAEYEEYKNSIYVANQLYKKATTNRGSYSEHDLGVYESLTVEEMNAWINERAPQSSPFYNQGEAFLRASKESGLDPKYLFSHASEESGYGKFDLGKNNYFGIGAFNASPVSSAKDFSSSVEEGIVEGAKWIREHYYNKGRTTLKLMQIGSEAYAQTDGGSPLESWIPNILNIMY